MSSKKELNVSVHGAVNRANSLLLNLLSITLKIQGHLGQQISLKVTQGNQGGGGDAY